MFALYLLFFPPLYCPIDPEAAIDDTAEYDSFVDDQSLATEHPGKQSPSPLHISPIFLYLILALGIAAAC